jgi:hypothetical protein
MLPFDEFNNLFLLPINKLKLKKNPPIKKNISTANTAFPIKRPLK